MGVTFKQPMQSITVANAPILRGKIISFCLPDKPLFQEARNRGYVGYGSCPGGYEPLLKPVVAVAGDVVEFDVNGMRVNGRLLKNSIAQHCDQRGRELPIVNGKYYVQKGTVWVLSEYNPYSFDSRYFGGIAIEQTMFIATD